MSFAPINQKNNVQKVASPGTSQQSFQKRTVPLDSPGSQRDVLMPSNQNNLNIGLQNRLEVIESHLNRVCNQHDALMPLLSLLETVPKINNNEQAMKQMQKKISDLETKLEKLEQNCNSKNNPHVFVQIDRNFKNTSQLITQMKSEMKDIQTQLQNNTKQNSSQLREESQNLVRSVEVRIDKNKKDIQNLLAEFKNSISLSIKRQEDFQHTFKGSGEPNEHFERNLQDKVDGYIDTIQKQYDRDINNLYREIGMLRSELEQFYDKGRKAYIFNKINEFPPNLDHEEKKIAIANIEQSVFFEDIERFDIENQERLVYELDCLEDKVIIIFLIKDQLALIYVFISFQIYFTKICVELSLQMKIIFKIQIAQLSYLTMNGKNQSEIKQEVTFLEDRFFSLKNQIHGTKKKYLVDVRKIEDRLEKLMIMKDQQLEKTGYQMNKMDNLVQESIQEIDHYPERIKQLNDSINTNVELLQARQKEIDEKLNLLKMIRN
ncbi:hypothetical protein TTHERM_00146220 (macronuclear) [Tetrahymena thermophila SB210]|uniref:Uncharacterized protein n=1 Tax=Tetrahymena thermophila (strain SB210) TaxID=312017 RepID=I7MI96_TETTS|nr:hypothetical protein TTHERM_00146220 [Tetrahymena thermophila SB210]EAR91016.2 hypothetical protein TTHERM_00146220 [Tetrahymena thermophila SB210]|eukprot:XP_001011261.2 hypothetical protein TTHERM_00146220 [Tetrahymena thermophila SB210]